MKTVKTYSELILLNTFKERYEYLRINNNIGEETFGYDRYLNQMLYHSNEWESFRKQIIIRDCACDLAMPGFEINNKIIIHHINPITKQQILDRDYSVFDPENVISCSHSTHMAIHYGRFDNIDNTIVVRRPNDTCPWKH